MPDVAVSFQSVWPCILFLRRSRNSGSTGALSGFLRLETQFDVNNGGAKKVALNTFVLQLEFLEGDPRATISLLGNEIAPLDTI